MLKARLNVTLHVKRSQADVMRNNARDSAFCDNKAVFILMSLPDMKKWLLLSALLVATPAFSENWVRYAQTDEVGRYYDKFRMVNMSGNAFIWDLHDLQSPATDASGKTYQSVLLPTEFSCRKHQRRVLSTQKMSDRMGTGALITEQNVVGVWVDVVPQTPDDDLMRAVCESQ